jgi:heme/copper-type cytochrome/quinol oxidase subunit 3
MEIPYTVEARPDTGLNNGKIGIWLFLASEVMLFGALFATYIMLRVGATDWPLGASILNVKMATLNTVVLITSSVTMVMAWASLARGQFDKYRLYMFATVGLGFVFMIVKYFEYSLRDHRAQAVGVEPRMAHEPRGERGAVLALRGSGLDLPLPDLVLAVGPRSHR